MERIKLYGKPDQYYHDEYSAYIEEFILRPEFYMMFLEGSVLIQSPASQVCLMECASPISDTFRTQFAVLIANVLHAPSGQRMTLWKQACVAVDKERGQQQGAFERRFIFAMMFPRLDGNVTTSMNHCVKSPFAMHPATKRCCVPIPDIDTWRPHMAPRISELCKPPVNPKDKPRVSAYAGADDWVHNVFLFQT